MPAEGTVKANRHGAGLAGRFNPVNPGADVPTGGSVPLALPHRTCHIGRPLVRDTRRS